MNTVELLKKVRKIEIKTRGLSSQMFSGGYHSAFKGRGMSFSEVREYQYGDDIRNIDWNVTARFNHPYIKIFEEERELVVMLLIDVSRSSFFGTQTQFKSEIITEICAVLSFSAINNNDKVGVIFFSDQIEKFIPPKKGKTHILRIIRELLDFKPEHRKTNIGQALKYFQNVMKKRSIAFLISDFIDDSYYDNLRIVANKHDLVGIHLYDVREYDLPNIGLIRGRDPETGRVEWIDTSSKKTRVKYKAGFLENQETMNSVFTKAGADLVSIDTRESYINALLRLFRKRQSRR
ncbi:MAG: DUF58 domain-containing protein [Chitinophagales bacterium]|nr:DUF58 domain-containing protein [Chitinophagales bacterium]